MSFRLPSPAAGRVSAEQRAITYHRGGLCSRRVVPKTIQLEVYIQGCFFNLSFQLPDKVWEVNNIAHKGCRIKRLEVS